MRPLKKGPNTNEQNSVLSKFSEIMNGNVLQKDNKFYLKVKGAGEFEMGLVSEGYRKLSTLTYLILSGSLNKNAILFWDEPAHGRPKEMWGKQEMAKRIKGKCKYCGKEYTFSYMNKHLPVCEKRQKKWTEETGDIHMCGVLLRRRRVVV